MQEEYEKKRARTAIPHFDKVVPYQLGYFPLITRHSSNRAAIFNTECIPFTSSLCPNFPTSPHKRTIHYPLPVYLSKQEHR